MEKETTQQKAIKKAILICERIANDYTLIVEDDIRELQELLILRKKEKENK